METGFEGTLRQPHLRRLRGERDERPEAPAGAGISQKKTPALGKEQRFTRSL